MTRVLVVEDEESFSDALSYMLRREGYEVAVAGSGIDALATFDRSGADLVLLDLMLPGLSGTEVCRALRQRSRVPIIIVTARDSEVDKVVGLELGADDYVTKPFSSRELVARIRAVLRRGVDADDLVGSIVEAGPVRMDVERHTVSVDGRPCRCHSRSSTCSSCCCATRAECSPAANSSTGSGGPTTWATRRRSTSTSSGCGARSNRIRRTPSIW